METPASLTQAARLSVAPMMAWTDLHCRRFHRLMSGRSLLYTEMITSAALVRGGAHYLLEHDPGEQPLAVQLGGSDPAELAEATKICALYGYGEVNLNIGCPSSRVQSGAFGAVLMKDPELVSACVSEMQNAAQDVEITVKCRIGVDQQDPHEVLPDFLEMLRAAGVKRLIIHARKALLAGLSPKQNRDVPPLDYPLVYAMKQQFPQLHLSLNGGVATLEQAQVHLAAGMDGVMIGRAAYHDPAKVLLGVDTLIFGGDIRKTAHQVALEMLPHIEWHLSRGGKLHDVTRHMLGLFMARPGARAWRRILSEGATKPDAGPDLFLAALGQVPEKPEMVQ